MKLAYRLQNQTSKLSSIANGSFIFLVFLSVNSFAETQTQLNCPIRLGFVYDSNNDTCTRPNEPDALHIRPNGSVIVKDINGTCHLITNNHPKDEFFIPAGSLGDGKNGGNDFLKYCGVDGAGSSLDNKYQLSCTPAACISICYPNGSNLSNSIISQSTMDAHMSSSLSASKALCHNEYYSVSTPVKDQAAGIWKWRCSDYGNYQDCSALLPVDGKCMSNVAPFAVSSPPTDNLLCDYNEKLAGGFSFTSTSANSGKITWGCQGKNSGVGVTCPPADAIINGACVNFNASTMAPYTTPPTQAQACQVASSTSSGGGVSTAPQINGAYYVWDCIGSTNGGTSTTQSNGSPGCWAPRVVGCGSAVNATTPFSTPPTSGLCDDGSVPAIDKNDSTHYRWNCPNYNPANYGGNFECSVKSGSRGYWQLSKTGTCTPSKCGTTCTPPPDTYVCVNDSDHTLPCDPASYPTTQQPAITGTNQNLGLNCYCTDGNGCYDVYSKAQQSAYCGYNNQVVGMPGVACDSNNYGGQQINISVEFQCLDSNSGYWQCLNTGGNGTFCPGGNCITNTCGVGPLPVSSCIITH